MENHTDQIAQYAKISTLYKAIIYLQEEIKKEKIKLDKLKEKECKKK